MIEVRAKRKAKARLKRRNSGHLSEHVKERMPILQLNQTAIKLPLLSSIAITHFD
jgi:hypothetical protein